MKRLFLTILLLGSALSVIAQQHAAYTPDFKVDGSRNQVRNVILLIGDGMGLAHIAAGLYSNDGALTLTNLRNMGLVLTSSASHFTTDSAAGATAYSAGVHTYNSAIGVDADTLPLRSITEFLAPLGWKTGVLTTDFIDGATPAAFYAHQKERHMASEILGDLPGSYLNFIGGGSVKYIDSVRPQLWNELSATGFALRIDGLINRSETLTCTNPLRFAVIANDEEVMQKNLGRGDFLPRTATFAFNYLKSLGGKGFFIMVEGAQIDWGGHNNDFPYLASEMLDFDLAVEAAIRFAEADKHTLVIVTADHETGGLSLQRHRNKAGEPQGAFASDYHTPIPVMVFAYGPYSDLFRGTQENIEIIQKIARILIKKSLL